MSRDVRTDDRIMSPVASRDPDRTRTVPLDRLTLRPGPTREPFEHRGRTYHLRDSDVRILATIGTFRVVRADDLQALQSSRDAWVGDLGHLRHEGLISARTVPVNGDPVAVVILTREGKGLLDAHLDRSEDGRTQAFHAGLVKPRELGHDAQLYRLFQAEAARIEAEGGRIERVVLDYELKRDYQSFLNRPDKPTDVDREDDVRAFAARRGMTVVDGHLELPDLRIEYEGPSGEALHRDVELVTEHYSRSQLAGKARAGFSMYRAASSGRLGSSAVRASGTPHDPHHLEWLG